jgi:hypothetical protein
MSQHPRQQFPLRPDRTALDELAMMSLTRACIATAQQGFNKSVRPAEFARRAWGDEARGVETVLKAASAPATTTAVGWARELSPVTMAFLINLVPMSAGADLLRRALLLQFGQAGEISVPNVSVPLADFVGQGAPIPVVNGAASIQATLQPFKFAVIAALTRQMIEGANAESLTRVALLESTGPALDRRLFDANAGVPDVRPPGLLNGIAALPAAAAGAEAMTTDLAAIATAIAPKAGNGGMTIIAAAPQAVAIGLKLVRELPWPLLTSTSLPAGTVIAIANAALVAAAGEVPVIDTTAAASLHMDSAAGPIADGGTMSSPVTATFQTDTVGLRMRWPLSWALRDAGALAWVQNTNW